MSHLPTAAGAWLLQLLLLLLLLLPLQVLPRHELDSSVQGNNPQGCLTCRRPAGPWLPLLLLLLVLLLL